MTVHLSQIPKINTGEISSVLFCEYADPVRIEMDSIICLHRFSKSKDQFLDRQISDTERIYLVGSPTAVHVIEIDNYSNSDSDICPICGTDLDDEPIYVIIINYANSYSYASSKIVIHTKCFSDLSTSITQHISDYRTEFVSQQI